MALPNLSFMMHVGQLRHIQWTYEAPEYRNPDAAVGGFLSFRQRFRCAVRGRLFLSRLPENPFYHFVLARTRYYDEVFLDAVYEGARSIINIGCGSDTRAYRFAHILKQKSVTVLECDQPEAIRTKEAAARRHWPTDHVRYIPLDLNDADPAGMAPVLDEVKRGPVLVMMEGVSPYVSSESFAAFLRLLAANLHPRSHLAYDFKIRGAADNFGRTDRVPQPFRLPADRAEVNAFHEAMGFQLRHMELSADLVKRLLPSAPRLFTEDCSLRLIPRDPAAARRST